MKIRIFSFILISLLMSVRIVQADLTFSVSSPQKKILVCEPYFVNMALKNLDKKKSIEVGAQLAIEYDYVKIFVSYDEEEFKRVGFGPVVDAIIPTSTLDPNESVKEGEMLLYNGITNEFVFERPGSYRVKFAFWHSLGNVSLESNILKVKVGKHKQSEALELFKGVDQSKFVMFGWYDESVVVKLQKLVDDYPKSVYSMYAAWSLGKYYFGQATKAMKRDFDLLGRSEAHFQNILKRKGPSVLMEESLFNLGLIAGHKKDFNQAKDYLKQLISDYPDTALKDNANGVLAEIGR